MTISGKKILFISPAFFGYEKALNKRMEDLGAQVAFYDERPSNSVFARGIIRVRKHWLQAKIQKYYNDILNKNQAEHFDYLLLIKGESVPHEFLTKFRAQHPEATMIYYSYDAVAEYAYFQELFPLFHRCFTFEPSDAEKYRIGFRPLFFIDEYFLTDRASYKYDLVFIGSAHTDRYLVGEKIRIEMQRLEKKSFFYYYAPGRLSLYLKRIFDKNFHQFDLKKVSFTKFSHAEIAEVFQSSVAVLDINKPFQSGVSMRSFEVLASGRKLITTNADVANYTFYNPNNILIIDRNSPEIPPEFFDTPFEPIPGDMLAKMSIDGWLADIFFPKGESLRNVGKTKSAPALRN